MLQTFLKLQEVPLESPAIGNACVQKRGRAESVLQEYGGAPILGPSKAHTLGGVDRSVGLRKSHLAVAGDRHTPDLTHF